MGGGRVEVTRNWKIEFEVNILLIFLKGALSNATLCSGLSFSYSRYCMVLMLFYDILDLYHNGI